MSGESDDLYLRVLQDLQRLENLRVHVELRLDVSAAMAIIGSLQLALRHPSFQGGYSANRVKQFVNDVASAIAQFDAPALQELIERGWDPKQDDAP